MNPFGSILTVKYADLTRTDNGEPVMKKANYDKLVNQKRITVIVRGGGLGREAEVDWSTLPDRFKQRYIAKYGDPEEEEARRNAMITYDNKARAYFAAYRLPDGSALKQDKQTEYLINASVLNLLLSLAETQRRSRRQQGNRTAVAWDNIFEVSEDLRASYGHSLPSSEKRLRSKMSDYERDGYACLVSGKIGNANTTKITAEGGEWLIAHKCSLNPVYTNQQLFDRYNEVAQSKGWKPLRSVQTLLNFLERPEVKPRWYAVSQGSHRANLLYVRQNRTIGPSCRDALWYVDGTKANLYFRVYDAAAKKNKAATTNIVMVLDAYSGVFVGWHICATECFRTTYEAIRNAIENTGVMPFELVYDNQSGSKSKAAERWHRKLSSICHSTMPDNARSKTIEAAFGQFQAQVLHRRINYTGGNITARSSKARIDEARILSNIPALPTYTEFVTMIEECISEWNNMPHPQFQGKTRNQVYAESINERATVLDETIREDLFYISTEGPSTFTARGIEVTIDGQRRAYEVFSAPEVPNLVWRRDNTGRQFIVEYDPHDPSRVRLCVDDEKYGLQFNTWAEPYLVRHRAMQDQEDGERSAIIADLLAGKKEIVRQDIERRALQVKYGVGAEALGYKTPLPQGVSEREYLRFADEIAREGRTDAGEPEVAEVLEESTIGQIRKKESGFDAISALDRL